MLWTAETLKSALLPNALNPLNDLSSLERKSRNRHNFGETLPPEEKMWVAEGVDSHIQSCLRALAEGGAGAMVQAGDVAA